MSYLLDTHAFLWLADNPAKLSASARAAIDQPEADVFLSLASVWEISIKSTKKDLGLDLSVDELIRLGLVDGLKLLPIELEHVLGVRSLPPLHGDPFDRLLISQALLSGLTLITIDPQIKRYSVPTLW